MLRIALCEDDTVQRELTVCLLNEYIGRRELAARVKSFASGRELLNALYDGSFDVYLLDIVMPDMDGIELGRTIRQSDRECSILYLTSSPDFALAGYQARASAYLLKPVDRQALFGALDDAVSEQTRLHQAGILVKVRGGGTVRLGAADVLYAELKNRAVCYCLPEGSVDSMTITTSFREAVSPLLDTGTFFLCGSSFLVNLHWIRMVDKGGALFTDGRYLSLPRSTCPTLRSAWTDYWLEGGVQP